MNAPLFAVCHGGGSDQHGADRRTSAVQAASTSAMNPLATSLRRVHAGRPDEEPAQEPVPRRVDYQSGEGIEQRSHARVRAWVFPDLDLGVLVRPAQQPPGASFRCRDDQVDGACAASSASSLWSPRLSPSSAAGGDPVGRASVQATVVR